jgi:hypothetical protein
MALSLSELTSRRPLFKNCDGVVIAYVLVYYTPLLFVVAKSMLCVLSCARVVNTNCREYIKYQVGLELNGTHQLLVYADDVILLGDSVDTIDRKSVV